MPRAFSSRKCSSHEPLGIPESPARLTQILAGVDQAGWPMDWVESHPEVRRYIERSHSLEYVERFEEACRRGDGLLDSADNPLSIGTWNAAVAGVACGLAAADWAVANSEATFAAVRPPGHHAEREVAMGFCFFSNAAIVADYLTAHYALERVAIYDFDIHHGNGTQHILETRSDVLYVSSHQSPFYPGTGASSETGLGAGRGATVNVPLAAGLDDSSFKEACEERVLPAIERFDPQAIVVSAGFDGWRGDPLGGWKLGLESFEWLGDALGALGTKVDGRVVALSEGGYDVDSLSSLICSFLTHLAPVAGFGRHDRDAI